MRHPGSAPQVLDPWHFKEFFWPSVTFYDKQWDTVYSVQDVPDTIVVAGNMLGKDFISGFVVLWFFLTRYPCRVLTTSADHHQLEAVLWGEVRRFINTAERPILAGQGGLLLVNHLHLRKVMPDARNLVCPTSYVLARVAAKGEGLLGHHVADVGDGVPRTLFVADEASSVDDTSWDAAGTWAKRRLAIGNPYPCNNFFRKAEKEGDLWLAN